MIEVNILPGPHYPAGVKKPKKTFLNPQYIVQVIPMSSIRGEEVRHKTDVDTIFRSSIQMMDGTIFFCTSRAEDVAEKIGRRR
jgi:hypothetical protein